MAAETPSINTEHRDLVVNTLRTLPLPQTIYGLVGKIGVHEGLGGFPLPDTNLRWQPVWEATRAVVDDLVANGDADLLPPNQPHTDRLIIEAFQRITLRA